MHYCLVLLCAFDAFLCPCTVVTFLLGMAEPNQDKLFLASSCGTVPLICSHSRNPSREKQIIQKV